MHPAFQSSRPVAARVFQRSIVGVSDKTSELGVCEGFRGDNLSEWTLCGEIGNDIRSRDVWSRYCKVKDLSDLLDRMSEISPSGTISFGQIVSQKTLTDAQLGCFVRDGWVPIL